MRGPFWGQGCSGLTLTVTPWTPGAYTVRLHHKRKGRVSLALGSDGVIAGVTPVLRIPHAQTGVFC